MRDLTSAMQSALEARTVYPAALLELEFDSGTTRIWTGYGPLTWNGNTYQGAGELLAISPAEESTEVRANAASVELSGIPSAYISLALQEDYQGRTATQYLALFQVVYDTSVATGEVLETESGETLTTESGDPLEIEKAAGGHLEMIADPVKMFSGRMDQMQISEDGAESIIRLSLESHLIDLKTPREFRYNHQDQQIDYPNDRGFEYVASLQDKRLTWGPDNRSDKERAKDLARRRADVKLETRTRENQKYRYRDRAAVDDQGNVLESWNVSQEQINQEDDTDSSDSGLR